MALVRSCSEKLDFSYKYNGQIGIAEGEDDPSEPYISS